MSANELIERYAKKALQAWKSLPGEQREEERSFIMGFNAGWEEHAAQNGDMNNRLESQAAEIEKHTAEIAALKLPLQPTVGDRHLAAALRDGLLDEMETELAAQRIEQGQYYDCGDFGLVIENQRLEAEIERLASDDAIEAAAKAHCDYFGGEGWWDSGLLADTKPRAIEAMRIALQALKGTGADHG
ncbi:hypothetical protein [Caenibius sp. WL]|uniref:hypothetical protein n=1 Tax=Caenibius sp. WL TaxID=2872646 RepID=UPI001C99569E|nr:hypothetical protein [Caenibius sp. WL]QZP06846.1 hypothetical protein K5X80_08900 [Caenibius sp. WL]